MQFWAASRAVIVAGKGGVGKTTVAATLARAAAADGLRTLLVEVDPAGPLGPRLGVGTLRYDPVEVPLPEGASGHLAACAVTPDDALADYLDAHGLGRLAGRLARSGTLDVVATAAPGIDDLLVLGKLKQLERRADVDLVVLDAPAAGHAITFLQSAQGLLDAVAGGPVRTQAEDVQALLQDPARCRVVLVALAEVTPVNELVDTAYALEDRIGVALGPVVVNALETGTPALELDPTTAAQAAGIELAVGDAAALAAAAGLRRRRVARQAAEVARLRERLPLPQLALPRLAGAEVGPAGVDHLAQVLRAAITALDPEAP